LEYIQTHFDIREQDYLTFDAVRQVSKCFGRVIRSKTDYGVLIFADNRFHRNDKRAKLPGWVTQFMSDNQQDLTTDSAVAQIKRFLRQTGQPVDQNLLQNVLTHE
jgi:DNA excision repair protein ERCC-2